jgi:NADH dehydrogenase
MAAPRVVVIGGGFGGLEVCRMLAPHARKGRVSLTLVDKENFFQFNPLLPEVATGAVETRHIVYPLRSFCAPRGIRFLRNKVRTVDTEKKVLHLHNNLDVSYDILVVSAGSTTNYFGIPGAEENAFPFKTIPDAIRLRMQLIEMWELADIATDPEARRKLLTVVVAGGGITGVEVCSTMLQMFRTTMRRLYPNVPQSLVSVHLVEAGDRLLGQLRPHHSEVAEQHLRALGVNLVLNRKVTAVHADRVVLDDGGVIPAHTLLWTTGIRGQSIEHPWPWPLGRGGRLKVDAGGRVNDHVYAIGDISECVDTKGVPIPAVAQGAIQLGKVVVANILASQGVGKPREIAYTDLGYLVGLGPHSTVASFLGIPVSGTVAFYLWAFAYLTKMVGLRKQLEVAADMIKGMFVDHDTSEIHERRRMLRPQDLNPELG